MQRRRATADVGRAASAGLFELGKQAAARRALGERDDAVRIRDM